MLRQDAKIKSTILEDNFLLPHIFLKIIFVKQIYSHGHTELQHEVTAYNNTSHEVKIMTDKNNIRQWTTVKDRGSCWRCWNQPQKQPVFSDNYQALKRSTEHKESLDKSIYLQKELRHSTRLIQSHAANCGWCQGWNNLEESTIYLGNKDHAKVWNLNPLKNVLLTIYCSKGTSI